MSRILKSHAIIVDNSNRVTIEHAGDVFYEDYDFSSEDYRTPEEYEEALEEDIDPIQHVEEAKLLATEIIQNAKETAEKEANLVRERRISQTTAEINQMKAEAAEEATALKEEAKTQGYTDGIDSAAEQADEIIRKANEYRIEAERYREDLIAGIEPQMINLITQITDKLLECEKELNREAISILIKHGLNKVSLTENINVRVSSEDFSYIDKDLILSSLDVMVDVEFSEDPTLNKLDCIIETQIGNINCGLDTQYKSLKKNLYYILKNKD